MSEVPLKPPPATRRYLAHQTDPSFYSRCTTKSGFCSVSEQNTFDCAQRIKDEVDLVCGLTESGPLRAVHLSRHKWPGGLVN